MEFKTIHAYAAEAVESFQKRSLQVYAEVLANFSSDEEQLSNELQSPQELKLHCGMHNVITLGGPESKSCTLIDSSFLSVCIQACDILIFMKIEGMIKNMIVKL